MTGIRNPINHAGWKTAHFSRHMMGIARTNQDFSWEIGNVFSLVLQTCPGSLQEACAGRPCALRVCARLTILEAEALRAPVKWVPS